MRQEDRRAGRQMDALKPGLDRYLSFLVPSELSFSFTLDLHLPHPAILSPTPRL